MSVSPDNRGRDCPHRQHRRHQEAAGAVTLTVPTVGGILLTVMPVPLTVVLTVRPGMLTVLTVAPPAFPTERTYELGVFLRGPVTIPAR